MRATLAEAAAAMDGALADAPGAAPWEGAAIDSRAVRAGQLFFALAGARTDGHRFLPQALAGGAAAVVVHEPSAAPAGAPRIAVRDTFEALHALTRHARARVPRKLAGVTGSVGKTTTKELLAAMLARRFRVARTPGNLNSLYGFPLSLLNIPEDTEWMVAEMGMSTPRELARLSLLGRPDVAVFTSVRPVHLEFFGTLRAIAEAKAELLEGLAPGGVAVANADDPEVAWIGRRHEAGGGRVVWYGAEGEVRARAIHPAAEGVGTRFVLAAGGEERELFLPLHGLYNVENCLAAAAAAWAIGVPLAEIAAAAAEVRPAAMRGVVHRLAGGVTLIDDSYNSNPDALARALESASRLPARRRLAILGDMRELGPGGPEFHREAGRKAAQLSFSPVIGVGELARELVAGAAEMGAETGWFPDAAAVAEWAPGALGTGDLVLVKASRGVGLERVVQALMAEARA
ncbi:MAG TPA: UDP-N-acetylmuramoyl-tripeptide--D-alanyl-D-alanine ligase [Thermoanaerobaculia bacterium]|nr:UDP-N-acetylmuramoyl-tripeptide--D-alanyl-D-alanine ligase [Thermoanaerobaculia bacterium]